jgi:hypothetical protein
MSVFTPDAAEPRVCIRRARESAELEGRCASYDLRTMVMMEGWRIQAVKTARARKR